MTEIVQNLSAVSVLVDDVSKANELFDEFLTIADDEGFKGDRKIFQEFINKRSIRNEKLIFNYGFAWKSFDRVEAGFTIDDKQAQDIQLGYSLIIGVTLQDDLQLDGALLLTEIHKGTTYRYLKISGEGYVVSREYFKFAFDEMLEVYSNYLGKIKHKIMQAYESAKKRILLDKEIDDLIQSSHLARSIRSNVHESLNKLNPNEITLLEHAREFSKIGNEFFEHHGNRYFEVAGRILVK